MDQMTEHLRSKWEAFRSLSRGQWRGFKQRYRKLRFQVLKSEYLGEKWTKREGKGAGRRVGCY